MKRSTSQYLDVIAGGLFALSAYASQGYAHNPGCAYDTMSWNGITQNVTCPFGGPDGSATASSFSGVNGDGSGNLVLVANLTGASGIQAGHAPGARAIGLNMNGDPIPGCETTGGSNGIDFNTSQGTTVGDGFGCNDAKRHRLFVQLYHTGPL
jgi:hypothetical protein